MTKSLFLVLFLAVVGCQVMGCQTQKKTATDTTDSSVVQQQGTQQNTTDGAPATEATSDVKPSDTATQPPITGGILVTSPKQGGYVDASQLVITGLARTFENNVVYRITDLGTGQVIAKGFTTAQGEMGQFSPYTIRVMAQVMSKIQYPTRALIEVFEESAKDGSEINMVKVQVRLGMGPEKPHSLYVFLTNPDRGSSSDCKLVFGISRPIPQTQNPARMAMSLLLAGPMGRESADGYRTEIPEGTTLKNITIESGVAKVDFTSPPNAVAGSCRSQAVRAQVERTLLQFSTIEKVVITVNGKTDQWQP